MEMADNPKLDIGYCHGETGGKLEEHKATTQKISVLDHINGFQYSTAKSDNFVIDMEGLSHGSNTKDINPNSRITLQRSLSRKGSLRVGGGVGGGDRKIKTNTSANERDMVASSPRGPSMPEKASQLAVGTTDHSSSNSQVHHQITITTTGNMNASPPTEGRFAIRRNSFKRSSLSWTLDPRRVLFIFATLSSMGTMLLIYFTLSMGKLEGDDNVLD